MNRCACKAKEQIEPLTDKEVVMYVNKIDIATYLRMKHHFFTEGIVTEEEALEIFNVQSLGQLQQIDDEVVRRFLLLN